MSGNVVKLPPEPLITDRGVCVYVRVNQQPRCTWRVRGSGPLSPIVCETDLDDNQNQQWN